MGERMRSEKNKVLQEKEEVFAALRLLEDEGKSILNSFSMKEAEELKICKRLRFEKEKALLEKEKAEKNRNEFIKEIKCLKEEIKRREQELRKGKDKLKLERQEALQEKDYALQQEYEAMKIIKKLEKNSNIVRVIVKERENSGQIMEEGKEHDLEDQFDKLRYEKRRAQQEKYFALQQKAKAIQTVKKLEDERHMILNDFLSPEVKERKAYQELSEKLKIEKEKVLQENYNISQQKADAVKAFQGVEEEKKNLLIDSECFIS